jgi:hypothetical protein
MAVAAQERIDCWPGTIRGDLSPDPRNLRVYGNQPLRVHLFKFVLTIILARKSVFRRRRFRVPEGEELGWLSAGGLHLFGRFDQSKCLNLAAEVSLI